MILPSNGVAAANQIPPRQKAGEHPAPTYRITIDGEDISHRIRPRLINITITDNRGFEADTVDLTLDDSDGKLALPRKGATMQVWLGWRGDPMVNKGTYTIDELEHSGAPDQLSIRGKAADLRGSLNKSREQSYHDQTLGDILTAIAARNGVALTANPEWAGELLPHTDQQNENDAAFLSRLAKNYDAIATIKQGTLLFVKAGLGQSASGKLLPPVTITRQDGDSHRFAIADRDAYTGVVAYWQDNNGGKKQTVEVNANEQGKNNNSEKDDVLAGSGDNVKTLRHVYATKANAVRTARAEWDKLQRGVAKFSITLAKGRPELFPELPTRVQGFKPQIDALPWILTKVTHSLTENGYTNQLELEVKANDV